MHLHIKCIFLQHFSYTFFFWLVFVSTWAARPFFAHTDLLFISISLSPLHKWVYVGPSQLVFYVLAAICLAKKRGKKCIKKRRENANSMKHNAEAPPQALRSISLALPAFSLSFSLRIFVYFKCIFSLHKHSQSPPPQILGKKILPKSPLFSAFIGVQAKDLSSLTFD